MRLIDEYRAGPRTVLRPGDRFRVTGGPYFRCSSGTKVPMWVRGVFQLLEVHARRGRIDLVAITEGGVTAVLHVAGRRRNRLCEQMVCRPYRVTSRVRAPRPS